MVRAAGGTGTGKTTFLAAFASYIPERDRVVLLEDTAEVELSLENVVRFEARRELPGLPAVTIRDLLRATLRHRPDRIVTLGGDCLGDLAPVATSRPGMGTGWACSG